MEELTAVQVRVVGCLIEKEMATPDNYPLSMNSLLAACNQTSNRGPVVSYDEATVSNALENLRARGLARVVYSRSNRVDKYRHVLHEMLELSAPELAVLCMLMVRGPQTPAELRARTERLHAFADQAAVEATLAALAGREPPVVRRLPRQPGQKEARWAQLLGGEVTEDHHAATADGGRSGRSDRLSELETAVQCLREDLARLRGDHDALAERLRGLLA